MSPVEYADGKRSLRAYIAVCLQIHCRPSSLCHVCCLQYRYRRLRECADVVHKYVDWRQNDTERQRRPPRPSLPQLGGSPVERPASRSTTTTTRHLLTSGVARSRDPAAVLGRPLDVVGGARTRRRLPVSRRAAAQHATAAGAAQTGSSFVFWTPNARRDGVEFFRLWWRICRESRWRGDWETLLRRRDEWECSNFSAYSQDDVISGYDQWRHRSTRQQVC